MKWLIRESSLATAVAALLVVVQPDSLTGVARAWLVVIAFLTSAAVLGRVFGGIPEEPQPVDSVSFPQRGEVRQMPDNDQANDFVLAVEYQLFPFLQGRLREIAAQRLLANHNVVLEREPDRARMILGDDIWQLVRFAPESSQHPRWDTVTIGQLATVTDALENV
jgi:hypothetical protein